MKKYLITLAIFLTSFFIITGNVKATNIDRGSVILDESVYGKYFDSLDNASETMKNNYNTAFNNLNYNEKTEDYVCGNIGLVSQDDVICYKWDKNVTFSHPPQIAFTNWNETGSSDALMYFVAWNNTSFNITSCYNSNSCSTKSQQYIGSLTTNPILNKQSISNKVVQGKKNIFYYKGSIDIIFGNYTRFNCDYFSTLIIKDENEKQHTFNYGDTLLRPNGNLNIGPTEYTYENLLNTTTLNKIEFNFTIPTDNKSFDLDLLTTFSDYYLSKPYLKITDTFDNVTISEIDDFLGERTKSEATDINGNEIYQYSGSFGIDFLDIKEVKLIFDVSNYTDDLYINFTSSFDYEVNYINSIDEIEYYKTIMMDNKYGLYLIPKTINTDNFSNINLNGIYNIEVRNNYTGNNDYTVLETLENYTEPNFQYVFKFNEYNYLLYFENTKYNTEEDDTYYVTFDTRHYNYSIKKLMFDEPVINNPNTGEEIKLPSNDSVEQIPQDMNSFIKYIEKIFDGNVIKEIFNNIYELFRNTRLGIYIFIIIVSSLILLWIKSMK